MSHNSMNSFQSTTRALQRMLMNTELPGNKLPSEVELAKRMRMSVVTLRQALTALEAEGYITKRQGLGSFVHTHALDPFLRSDMGDNMVDFVGSTGGEVDIQSMPISTVGADIPFQELLQGGHSRFALLELHYFSNNQLQVIARNYIPVEYLVKPVTSEKSIESLDHFVWEYCQRTLSYELTSWEPRLTPADLAVAFGTETGGPMLVWHQLVYDSTETALCGCEVFFSPKFGNPRILRKWNFTPPADMEML